MCKTEFLKSLTGIITISLWTDAWGHMCASVTSPTSYTPIFFYKLNISSSHSDLYDTVSNHIILL